jgi:hypothetical protein
MGKLDGLYVIYEDDGQLSWKDCKQNDKEVDMSYCGE